MVIHKINYIVNVDALHAHSCTHIVFIKNDKLKERKQEIPLTTAKETNHS